MRHPLALDLAGHTRAHMCKPCDARASTAAAIASSHAYLHAQLCRALRSPHSCSHFNSGRYYLNNALQDTAVGEAEGLPRHAQPELSSVAHSVAEQNRLPHSAVGRAL